MDQLRYQDRTLSPHLCRAVEQFPAVVITGPRQSGKTTLVQHLFGPSRRYVTLDDPATRQQAISDPRLLLSRFPAPVIIDEIQYAPGLLPYVKLDIDNNRSRRGGYILTGSQVFPLMHGVAESLAGRAAIVSLLSMSFREVAGFPDLNQTTREMFIKADSVSPSAFGPKMEDITGAIYRGGFPEPALSPEMDHRLWHSSYVQTYLERDVRSLRSVGDLHDFQRFLFAMATRTGSPMNFTDLARDLGVTGKTVQAWVSVLEASGQVITLKPYHASKGKRLVKRPKIYFLDTGTLSYLLDVIRPEEVLNGMVGGPLFEAAVFGQLVRMCLHRGETPRIFYWRTSDGHEVDFIIEEGSKLIPVEAKLTATPAPHHTAGIEKFQKLFGSKAGRGLVVCLCRERFPITRDVDAVPFGSF